MFGREKERLDLKVNMPEKLYPSAQFIPHLPKMKPMGKYKNNFPEGIIIHYTAGSQDQSGESAIKHAIDNGFTYFFIDKEGYVYQQFDLHSWGYHAGTSQCPVTKRQGVSRFYVGIEVACSGLLTDSKTWFGQTVPSQNIRTTDNSHLVAGQFQKFTILQEKYLMKLCIWLCQNGVKPELVFGHNEVTPRKVDPGGSLSMGMDYFRKRLKEELWKLSPS